MHQRDMRAQRRKGRAEFTQQVTGFGKLMPDLEWSIREVLVDDDRIVVRSTTCATPAGDFVGVPRAGRRFLIPAIDLHTVRDGKLVQVYHVEDRAGALRQLSGR